MTKKDDARWVRSFLEQDLPLLPGAYPGRPAPVHIGNNFVRLACGSGSAHSALSAMLADGEGIEVVAPELSVEVRDLARELLRTVLDSDGNVYRTFGSPLPILASFSGPDPTDGNYAKALWRSIPDGHREEIRRSLERLLAPPEAASRDAVSSLAVLLDSKFAGERSTAPSGPEAEPTIFGERFGSILRNGLVSASASSRTARRLESIREFCVMLAGGVILGMLYDSVLAAQQLAGDSSTDPADVLGILVFTGQAPGSPKDPLVELSVRSLDDALHRARSGIVGTFAAALRSGLEESRRRALSDRLEHAVTQRVPGRESLGLVDRLTELNGARDPEAAADAIVDTSNLRLGIKSLGYKTGLCAPQRNGAPRLVLETGFLSALVGYVAADGMEFQSFVDELYVELGIIVGNPSSLRDGSYRRLERVAGDMFDVDECLKAAQEQFRLRLVNSGMAREFSDGHTIMELAE